MTTETDEDGRTTILLRTHDTLRARMIAELLEEEGIPVSTPGLEHRSMLGMIGAHIEVVLHVRKTDLERAKELVSALDGSIAAGEDDEDDEDESPRGTASVEPAPEVKLKRIAAFAALVIPLGGGHMYVRRYATAGLLALLVIGSWVAMISGVPAAFLLLPAVIAADYLGAAWHCDRIAAGKPAPERGHWRRFAVPVAASIVVVWCILGPGPGAALIAGSEGRAACETMAMCSERALDLDACVTDVANDRIAGRNWECIACFGRAETCDAAWDCERHACAP